MDPVAERVGRNEATFRAANERIESAARDMTERVPFICECSDTGCLQLVLATLEEYEIVRGNGRRFLNAPGHESNSMGWGEVVATNDRFVTVEKTGDAARVAEDLATRTEQE